ncbi:hypothetical protein EWB00_000354 [Schistosoma japonicum]|uniref:Uncharacterized protein n=1 Tax=Schistosoma japonicum TaxID=6182 RepID=A0A4Z2CKI8_SCHJA|nr:hypothetical protein EWB00_000354 [Schistosoma japonicum]
MRCTISMECEHALVGHPLTVLHSCSKATTSGESRGVSGNRGVRDAEAAEFKGPDGLLTVHLQRQACALFTLMKPSIGEKRGCLFACIGARPMDHRLRHRDGGLVAGRV